MVGLILLLIGIALFLLLAVLEHESRECKHENKAIFYSRNRKMCIDCGELFSLKEDEKIK